MQNRKARPVGYVKENGAANAKWSSRNMGILGTIILVFLVSHMQTFWYKMHFGEMPRRNGLKDLHTVVVEFFSPDNPIGLIAVVGYVLPKPLWQFTCPMDSKADSSRWASVTPSTRRSSRRPEWLLHCSRQRCLLPSPFLVHHPIVIGDHHARTNSIGPLAEKWTSHKNHINLVNPANKRLVTSLWWVRVWPGARRPLRLRRWGTTSKRFASKTTAPRTPIAAQGGSTQPRITERRGLCVPAVL